jgi:glutamine cyclotransferase
LTQSKAILPFRQKRIPVVFAILVAAFCSGCSDKKKNESTAPETSVLFSVVRVFPHDKSAFTQGLVIDNGKLFESTGRENSWIAEVDIATGRQDKKVVLDKKYFGEGITIFHRKIYQLTWQNHEGFVYALDPFKKIKQFKVPYEGWGITHDSTHLIVSDGTETLHFLDTATLADTNAIQVHDAAGPVTELNELEFINGFVYANQWQTNFILKIDPSTGAVVGKMDLSVIGSKIGQTDPKADVLNGIAYDTKSKIMLVTGKLWPYLYAVKLK